MADLQDIVTAMTELSAELRKHIALSQQQDQKIDQMFTVLITGNGVPSIKERVARLEENMLDKTTAKELEIKIDKLESMLPDSKEWSEIKTWAFWSKIVVGAIGFLMIGLFSAMGQAIFRWLAGL